MWSDCFTAEILKVLVTRYFKAPKSPDLTSKRRHDEYNMCFCLCFIFRNIFPRVLYSKHVDQIRSSQLEKSFCTQQTWKAGTTLTPSN